MDDAKKKKTEITSNSSFSFFAVDIREECANAIPFLDELTILVFSHPNGATLYTNYFTATASALSCCCSINGDLEPSRETVKEEEK